MQIKFAIALTLLVVASADLATEKMKALKVAVNQAQQIEVVETAMEFDCNDRAPMASCLFSTREECNAAKVGIYACVWSETVEADLPFIEGTKSCSDGSLFYDGVSAGTVYQEWDLACCKETTNECR